MKCPLCDYDSTIFLLEADAREYRSCEKCYLVFVPSKFFISRKREIERYLEHNNTLTNEGYVMMFQKKINTIKKICSGINTVLDYGCGYEPVLKILLEREGYKTHGYDLNFFPNEALDGKHNLIISTETFEHIKNPRKDLASLTQNILSKGYLAIMTRFYPLRDGALCLESFTDWYYNVTPLILRFTVKKRFHG